MRSVHEKHNKNHVFQFLMGLNDSFSHIRGQILLNDPLLPINKVFSLVIQEDRQKDIYVSPLIHETTALMTKVDAAPLNKLVKQNNRKVRLTCSHCGTFGHTVDKCYKLHGFPLGFKFTKNKFFPHLVNQVKEVDLVRNQPPQLPISLEQCQQLLAFMIQHQSAAPIASAHSVANEQIPQDNLHSKMTRSSSTSCIFPLNPICCFFFHYVSYFYKSSITKGSMDC
jgi:hypothetical protein